VKPMSSQPTTYTTYTTDRGYYWYAGVRHAQIGQCKGCSVSGVSGVSGQWVSLHQFNGQTVITGAGPRVSRLWFGSFYLLVRGVPGCTRSLMVYQQGGSGHAETHAKARTDSRVSPRLFPPLHGIERREEWYSVRSCGVPYSTGINTFSIGTFP